MFQWLMTCEPIACGDNREQKPQMVIHSKLCQTCSLLLLIPVQSLVSSQTSPKETRQIKPKCKGRKAHSSLQKEHSFLCPCPAFSKPFDMRSRPTSRRWLTKHLHGPQGTRCSPSDAWKMDPECQLEYTRITLRFLCLWIPLRGG